MDDDDGFDVSSLRAVTTGGAPLGADMQARLQEVLGCPVAQGYGCTEAGVAFSDSTGLPGQPPPKPGSLGCLQPWVYLRVSAVQVTDAGLTQCLARSWTMKYMRDLFHCTFC